MIFRQLFDHKSSTYTYLLASRSGGEAVLIDPVDEFTDMYVTLIKQLDLRLVYAIDTHTHADHRGGPAKLNNAISEQVYSTVS